LTDAFVVAAYIVRRCESEFESQSGRPDCLRRKRATRYLIGSPDHDVNQCSNNKWGARLSSTKTLYLLFNGSQRWGWHPRRSSRLGLFRLVGGKLVDVETADQVRRAINAKTAALIMVSDADLASRLLLQAAEKDDR
jgi:hypothetical protein